MVSHDRLRSNGTFKDKETVENHDSLRSDGT